jgi:hypothetical protein
MQVAEDSLHTGWQYHMQFLPAAAAAAPPPQAAAAAAATVAAEKI